MEANEFKRLFLPCQSKLYRIAFALLGNSQDAEDIVQDAYLKLWNRRNELQIDTSPEGYCVILVKNLCMDFLRKSQNRTENLADRPQETPTADDLQTQLENHSDTEVLKQLIRQLPETQKRVLWLRDVNDCSFEEIGQATGLNPVNIRATLSKARKKIREQFKKYRI